MSPKMCPPLRSPISSPVGFAYSMPAYDWILNLKKSANTHYMTLPTTNTGTLITPIECILYCFVKYTILFGYRDCSIRKVLTRSHCLAHKPTDNLKPRVALTPVPWDNSIAIWRNYIHFLLVSYASTYAIVQVQ